MDPNKIDTRTVKVIFEVKGLLRFLSHQETARMFKRAIARSGVRLHYSQGFNPHPKMSLPLPRSVSMASECELLQLSIVADEFGKFPTADQVRSLLEPQMPEDIEIANVEIYEDKVKFNPADVTYSIPVRQEENIKKKITDIKEQLDSGSSLILERVSHKTGKSKCVDLADFIEKMEISDKDVTVVARILNGTSVKLEELTKMFGIEESDLNGPIVRENVEWNIK
ncbi:MAG: TIGR03936 family radical SAM-associated protein [Sedimentisphaeraceae bacterium JB056]